LVVDSKCEMNVFCTADGATTADGTVTTDALGGLYCTLRLHA